MVVLLQDHSCLLKICVIELFSNIIYLLYIAGRFEQNDVCCVEINCSRPFTLLKQIMLNIDNTDFLWRSAVAIFENSPVIENFLARIMKDEQTVFQL